MADILRYGVRYARLGNISIGYNIAKLWQLGVTISLQVNLVEDNQFTIAVSSETNLLSFMHADSETIVASLNHIKHRYQLMQPDSYTPHTKIKPKDVPGTLLNVVSVVHTPATWVILVVEMHIHVVTSFICC